MKKTRNHILLLIAVLISSNLLAQEADPVEERTIENSENLIDYYRAAVLGDFISGKENKFEFKASLYGLTKIFNKDLSYNGSSYFLRNTSFKVGFAQDDGGPVNSFTPGITYAFINKRDRAMYSAAEFEAKTRKHDNESSWVRLDIAQQQLVTIAAFVDNLMEDSLIYGPDIDRIGQRVNKSISRGSIDDNFIRDMAMDIDSLQEFKRKQEKIALALKEDKVRSFGEYPEEIQDAILSRVAEILIEDANGGNTFKFQSKDLSELGKPGISNFSWEDDFESLPDEIQKIVKSQKYFVYDNNKYATSKESVGKIIDRLELLTGTVNADIGKHVNSMTFETKFQRSLNAGWTDQNPWDLVIDASYEISNTAVGDSVSVTNDITERQVFKGSVGLNKVLLSRDFKRDKKMVTESMIEIKPFFEYERIVAGRMLADLTDEDTENDEDEKENQWNAGVTFKFRVAKDVFIPVDLKVDLETGEIFGFLTLSWNFSEK